MMRRRLTSRGDTIVEVLISIAIVGLALAAAYATANRSSQNDQTNQEHEIALTIAQSQAEQLNNLPTSSTNSLATIATASASCFSTTGVLAASGATYAADCINYNSAIYPEDFTVNIKQVIAPNANPVADKPLGTFEVSVEWPKIAGGTNAIQVYFQPAGST
jgi:prepilin-type N-terminal cleavage/methylation domain-containing protein